MLEGNTAVPIEEAPKDPELIKRATVEALKTAGEEVLRLRKSGTLPDSRILELYGLHIDETMPLDDRLVTVSDNGDIFSDAIETALSELEPEILKKRVMVNEPPEAKIFDWRTGEHPIRTVYYRLGPQIALMDNYYMDDSNNPVEIRPQLWFSNDFINRMLKDHAPELLPETPAQEVAFRR